VQRLSSISALEDFDRTQRTDIIEGMKAGSRRKGISVREEVAEYGGSPKRNHPTLVSLFTGAGGLDIGLERAGFHTVVATDFDEECIETLRFNQTRRVPIEGSPSRFHLEGARIIHADVATLSARDFGIPEGEELDLVAGGPPCQPFSSAGSQRGLDDPRGQLFQHFARLVSELRPRMFLFENVRGLVTARGPSGRPGEALELVRKAFEDAGYATRCELLNAADYGAAQRRVRLFIIGSRMSSLPEFPEPTNAEDVGGGLFDDVKPWNTLGNFLASMPPPAESEICRPSAELGKQLRKIPSGSGLKSPGVKETTRPGGHWGYKQGTFIADPGRPARTVTAATTQDWIRLADGSLRRLTLSECAGLQGFPREWQFAGTRGSQFRQIGNAVPVAFGEAIGKPLAQLARKCHRGGCSGRRTESAMLPANFMAYVNYTMRDEARNGLDRPRSHRRLQASGE